VHYDDGGTVEYVEATPGPKHAQVALLLYGEDVTHASVGRVLSIVRPHSSATSKEANGYVFADLGLNTYNDVLQSDEDPVEAFGLERLEPRP
jgi:hypothetical protein